MDARKQQATVNICLLGRSGCGKADFIHNLTGERCRLSYVEILNAVPTLYQGDNNVVFWYSSGYDCNLYHTTKEYIAAMDMRRFDFILFFCHPTTFLRLKQDDIKLLKEVKLVGKPFFIVVSFFHTLVKNGNEEDIKEKFRSQLDLHNLPRDQFRSFFISNLKSYSHCFDYADLIKEFLNTLTSHKRDVFKYGMRNANIGINEKELNRRISTDRRSCILCEKD